MDAQRWNRLSLAEQMGHVTSEIARARVWEQKGDAESRGQAICRALDLIALSLEQPGGRAIRLREWTRLREVLSDCFLKTGIYDVTLSDLERYGLQFIC